MAAGHKVDGAGAALWLFRQGELVLGPVPTPALLDKLYAGELGAGTEVALAAERRFRRLGDIDFFRLHVAKAEAKARVEAAARDEQARLRRRRLAVGGALLALTLLLAAAAGWVARWLAVHGALPVSDTPALADVSVEPPTIRVARARRPAEELVDYPTPGSAGASAARPEKGGTRGAGAPVASSAPRPERRSAPAAGPRRLVTEEPDGMQVAAFDQAAINAVVARHQRALSPCFNDEVQRRSGFAAKVPLEFIIGNDGRVARLWVDHPDFRRGPVFDCLLRELQKWPFQAYEGERANVGLVLNVKGRQG